METNSYFRLNALALLLIGALLSITTFSFAQTTGSSYRIGDYVPSLGENGSYGYKRYGGDSTMFVIPPRFSDAGSFSEGLAPVCLNGKYGFIDKDGK